VHESADARGDEYDRSGLWLMKEGDVLEIGDVAPQSAGERAGLKVGDRVVAIDGAPVASRPLGEWRRELRERAAGTSVKLAIERDGRGSDISLALADRVPALAERAPGS